MITGHQTSPFIFNSTFCPFMPHITSSSPAESRFESTFKRHTVLLRSCAVIVIGTFTAFMKFLGKLWKRVGVLQNCCFSWKHSIRPFVMASLPLYWKCFYGNRRMCSLPFVCTDILSLGLTIHFKLHEICFSLHGFTWTNLIINRITATWLLAGVIYICSDSQDERI